MISIKDLELIGEQGDSLEAEDNGETSSPTFLKNAENTEQVVPDVTNKNEEVKTVSNFVSGLSGNSVEIEGTMSSNNEEEKEPDLSAFDHLSMQELKLQLYTAQRQLADWSEGARQILKEIILSPSSNEKYKQEVSEQLTSVLMAMEEITSVEFINCSFPAIDSQAPKFNLLSWTSLEKNSWNVHWAPSWAVTICADGWLYLPFKMKIVVRDMSVTGNLCVSFSQGLDYVWLSFATHPAIGVSVDVEILLGVVSMPFQSMIQRQVQREFNLWVENHLITPNKMRFKCLASGKKAGITEEDFQKAAAAAASAMRRSPIRQPLKSDEASGNKEESDNEKSSLLS
eukprot:m.39241 g.39241  ORF g.39241 m.39241 type:complete len:342 (+) comp9523_c1_seq2:3123-4148(+)